MQEGAGMENIKKLLPFILMAAILAALVLYGSGDEPSPAADMAQRPVTVENILT